MNNLQHYFIPDWVSIAFLILIPLPFILILRFLYRQSKIVNTQKPFYITLVFFIAYLVYIFLTHTNGLFNQVSFPPRVLLFTTFPYALILFVIVWPSKTCKQIIEQSAIEDIVLIHSARIVGVFFIIIALYDALPKPFAFIAGVGDVATAITSFFVISAIQNKNKNAPKIIYIWNMFGFVDIVFTAVAANVLTKLSIDKGIMGVDSLAYFPFCIIPAFAPPTILLLHLAIFRKLKGFSG
jgi:hypothetical protein